MGQLKPQPAPRHPMVHSASSEGRTTMLRKLTLALVAAASLGTMALAPTSASALAQASSPSSPWPAFRRRHRRPRLQRLLPHPHGVDAVRLSHAHRQRVPLLLIEPGSIRFTKPRSPGAAGVFASDVSGACMKGTRSCRYGDASAFAVQPQEQPAYAPLHHLPYGHVDRRPPSSQPLHIGRRRRLANSVAQPL